VNDKGEKFAICCTSDDEYSEQITREHNSYESREKLIGELVEALEVAKEHLENMEEYEPKDCDDCTVIEITLAAAKERT
jgi:hypothetical protein